MHIVVHPRIQHAIARPEPMTQPAEQPDMLRNIETLQDEVLTKLDDLNRQIESALAQHTPPSPVMAP